MPDTPSDNRLSVTDAQKSVLSLLTPPKQEDPPEPEDAPAPEDEPLDQAPEDEVESEQKPDDAQDETPLHTVVVNGEEQRVTLEEALKGYQRSADYTRKTQALADQRRQTEAELAAMRQAREQYAEKLKAMDELLAPGEEPDWDALKKESPEQYAVAHADWQRKKDAREAVQREQDQLAASQQAEQQTAFREVVERETEALYGAIPEWQDDTKRIADQKALVAYGKAQGFTAEELESTIDHRAIVLLRKAMLYDRGVQKVKTAEKKGAKTKTLKPGRGGKERPSPDHVKKHVERARKTGRVADAAAAVLALMEKEGPG